MWLKFRYPNMISDQEQVKKATGRNGVKSYLFWKKDGAICDVRNKDDIDFLLNPGLDRIAEYEVAYEMYGISFDNQGNELKVESATDLELNMSVSMNDKNVTVNGKNATETEGNNISHGFHEEKFSVRPKMSVVDRMAKARAARKLKKE